MPKPQPATRMASPRVATVSASLLSMLRTELVELGREAWRISERERAVRAEITALQELGENT